MLHASRILLCSCVLTLAAAADATIIRPQSVEAMTFRATAVVRCDPIPGTQVALLNPDGIIVTQMQFDVVEVLSGPVVVGEDITVEVVGGIMGDTALTIDQNAEFLETEQVVLFLSRETSLDPFRVIDLSAGKFEVNIDPDTLQVLLTRRDFGEIDNDLLRRRDAAAIAPGSLEELKERVTSADTVKRDLIQRGENPVKYVPFAASVVRAAKEEAKE